MYPCVLVIGEEKKTTAYSRLANGSIKKGTAVCKDGDEPKPIVGAIIALCKALGTHPTEAALDVLRACAYETAAVTAANAHRTKGSGVQVQVVKRPDPVNPQPGEVIGLISTKRGHVELALAEPLDVYAIRSMGKVGGPTKFKDCSGKKLQVGDLVVVDREVGDMRNGKTWEAIPGLHFVVDEDSDDASSKGAYIMGMLGGCNAKRGEFDPRFRIRLAKKWYEVELGEEHDLVRTVWKGVAQ